MTHWLVVHHPHFLSLLATQTVLASLSQVGLLAEFWPRKWAEVMKATAGPGPSSPEASMPFWSPSPGWMVSMSRTYERAEPQYGRSLGPERAHRRVSSRECEQGIDFPSVKPLGFQDLSKLAVGKTVL